MVNRELFLKIADRIEKEPKLYNQRYLDLCLGLTPSPCNTAHCIAGWACVLSKRHTSVFTAQTLLGITREDRDLLFYGDWQPLPDLTVPEALRLIADGASVSEVSHG